MNIMIRAQGLERSTAIDAVIQDELRAALARFSSDILAVDVSLKDTNGPKGGIDKQVLLQIRLRNGQQVALQTERENLYAAICISAKRARQAVRRTLQKSRRVEKLSLKSFIANQAAREVPGA